MRADLFLPCALHWLQGPQVKEEEKKSDEGGAAPMAVDGKPAEPAAAPEAAAAPAEAAAAEPAAA